MKILAIGDPHFKVDTLFDSDQYMIKVENAIKGIDDLDYIIVLGDVLHTHEKIYTFAMNMAVKFLKMCSQHAPTIVLVGNHDATSNTIFCGENHWMNVLKFLDNITVVDKPTKFEHEDIQFLCCPYVTDGRFCESLTLYCGEKDEEGEPEWQSVNIIFAHQLFNGAKMGAIVATDVEEWNVRWPTIISGHIHDKQQPQPNLYYIGSSQQHAFGESEDKSLGLITFNQFGQFVLEDVYLDLKKKKILYTSVGELAKLKLQEGITYKIVVEDEDAKLKAFKKTAAYKQLVAKTNIKAVQCRATEIVPNTRTTGASADFLTLLHERIEREADKDLKTYAESLLL